MGGREGGSVVGWLAGPSHAASTLSQHPSARLALPLSCPVGSVCFSSIPISFSLLSGGGSGGEPLLVSLGPFTCYRKKAASS